MPLQKIRDLPEPCISPEHNPPMKIALSAGEYEWTCPACGNKIQFVVYGFMLDNQIQHYVAYRNMYNESTWRGKPLSALTPSEWNDFDNGGKNAIY